jgi:nitrile hydratase accessory protein
MSQEEKSLITHVEDSMKLPRENGELVFHTPWEGRILAMSVLLLEKGFYPWKTFNGQFVQEIGEAERQHPEIDVASTYYQHWVKAFEKVLIEKKVLTPEQLQTRTHEFESGQRHHVC